MKGKVRKMTGEEQLDKIHTLELKIANEIKRVCEKNEIGRAHV